MLRKSMMAVTVAALFTTSAWAAVSADEAKQLGTTLTPVGAEKAANKDGTIPAWTGVPLAPPPGFQKGSGIRPDPFADQKPRLSITGKDVAAHADKLSEGTKELLKRYATMRVDVFPTQRSIVFPKKINDSAMKNATTAKSVDGGLRRAWRGPADERHARGVDRPRLRQSHVQDHILGFTPGGA